MASILSRPQCVKFQLVKYSGVQIVYVSEVHISGSMIGFWWSDTETIGFELFENLSLIHENDCTSYKNIH